MQGFCALEIMLRAKHGGRVSAIAAIALLLSCQMERSRKDPRQLAGGYQERRRAAALDKQRNARKEAANRARRLAIAAAESEGSSERASEVRDQGCAELCMTHRQCFHLAASMQQCPHCLLWPGRQHVRTAASEARGGCLRCFTWPACSACRGCRPAPQITDTRPPTKAGCRHPGREQHRALGGRAAGGGRGQH